MCLPTPPSWPEVPHSLFLLQQSKSLLGESVGESEDPGKEAQHAVCLPCAHARLDH